MDPQMQLMALMSLMAPNIQATGMMAPSSYGPGMMAPPVPTPKITQLPMPSPNPSGMVHDNSASADFQMAALGGGRGQTASPASSMASGVNGSQTQLVGGQQPQKANLPYDMWSAATQAPRGAPRFMPTAIGAGE